MKKRRAAIQQRGRLDRVRPKAGSGNQVSDACRHFRAQRKKEDFRFDAVRRHHLAIPDDFVQRVRNRVLSLEGDDLGLTFTLDLRHLERLLQEQETRSDNRDLTRNLVGVDEASQGGHGGVQPIVVAETRGQVFSKKLVHEQAARFLTEGGNRDVGRGEVDD